MAFCAQEEYRTSSKHVPEASAHERHSMQRSHSEYVAPSFAPSNVGREPANADGVELGVGNPLNRFHPAERRVDEPSYQREHAPQPVAQPRQHKVRYRTHDDASSLVSLLSCSQREGGGCFDRVLLLQSSNILYAIMALLKDLDRESLQIVRAELDNLLD